MMMKEIIRTNNNYLIYFFIRLNKMMFKRVTQSKHSVYILISKLNVTNEHGYIDDSIILSSFLYISKFCNKK